LLKGAPAPLFFTKKIGSRIIQMPDLFYPFFYFSNFDLLFLDVLPDEPEDAHVDIRYPDQ
jgi:hypothetical protein